MYGDVRLGMAFWVAWDGASFVHGGGLHYLKGLSVMIPSILHFSV